MSDLISISKDRSKLVKGLDVLNEKYREVLLNKDNDLILAIQNQQSAYMIALRLLDYEDLKEQGRLIILPCKVGDEIFLDFAGFGKDIDKFTVKDFHLDCFEDGKTILFCDYESNDKTLSGQIDVMEFGKTVFLTKAEAEQKLKEMESD